MSESSKCLHMYFITVYTVEAFRNKMMKSVFFINTALVHLNTEVNSHRENMKAASKAINEMTADNTTLEEL